MWIFEGFSYKEKVMMLKYVHKKGASLMHCQRSVVIVVVVSKVSQRDFTHQRAGVVW